MALELGDHVWYWNHRISLDPDIPRAQWFPGSNRFDANDYQGHGKEIYNYVIHSDAIACGQPQMRTGKGSFAWLNNNPGNITGRPGGPDFGQYPNKFNWHNFLIFPSWEAGYNAIAKYLRTGVYPRLSLLDAFEKYAPKKDGNNPVAYANAVANALGVPASTRVGDLDDAQMRVMQNKIQEIEGVVAGYCLPWDSADLPSEIAELLPARNYELSRTFALRRGGFTIDMSAPVDPAGFTRGYGGPGTGGHVSKDWFVQYGMDLGGAQGTPVYAAFDGHITKLNPHKPAQDSSKVYGAQIFIRSHNDMMGGFYTHLTNVPAGLGPGSTVARGDFLGTIHRVSGTSPHLHLALVEIIGGLPGGKYQGVDLYDFFLAMQKGASGTVVPVRFSQDGAPPEPLSRALPSRRLESVR